MPAKDCPARDKEVHQQEMYHEDTRKAYPT